MVADWPEALEGVIALKFARLLTSGLNATVLEGSECIRDIVAQARHVQYHDARYAHVCHQAAGRILVVPAGGVTEHNLRRVMRETGVRCNCIGADVFPVIAWQASEFHCSARSSVKSRMVCVMLCWCHVSR